MPLKGEIWLVNLDPTLGHEQAKSRPCVVVSNDQMNSRFNLSIIVPVTGSPWFTRTGKLTPLMVELIPPEGGLVKKSYSMAHQVRTVSHARFLKKLGTVSAASLDLIVKSIKDIIGN